MTDTVILKKETVDAMERAILDAPITLQKVIAAKNRRLELLRGALRVIQSVLPSKTPGSSDDYILEICKKYLND